MIGPVDKGVQFVLHAWRSVSQWSEDLVLTLVHAEVNCEAHPYVLLYSRVAQL